MKDRVQPFNSISKPEDVEPFDVTSEFKKFVEPALNAACAWLGDKGVPFIYITTTMIGKTEGDNVTVNSSQNVRANNMNIVRDFALCFAHEAIVSKTHVDLGTRIAELGSKSPAFLEAFFAHLERKGVLAEVQSGPIDEEKPITH